MLSEVSLGMLNPMSYKLYDHCRISGSKELVDFYKKTVSKVNIIEYNPIEDGEFKQTTPERLDNFVSVLEDNNVIVNVRRSRGKDIDAACGQLANKNKLAVIEYK